MGSNSKNSKIFKKHFINKKGEGGMAATLVFLFAVLLVLYVLLLPEADRNDLLDIQTNDNGNGSSSTGTQSKNILLDESPGAVDSEGRTQYDYTLPTLRLLTSTGAKVISDENPFVVKNSWFTKKSKTIEFTIDDVKNANNLILSFNVAKRDGTLIIKLNNEVIYEKALTQYNAEPVKLPKEKINNGINTLEISVSSVGIKFWSANEYSLENVKVMADLTDVSRQITENVFYITDARENIDTANLKFVPECDTAKVGKLTVLLNNNQISSAVPDCKVLNSLIVPPDYFATGVNNLEFKTESGNYLLDRILIRTQLKEKRQPKYYFYIDDDKWADIKGSDYVANLTMQFLVPSDRYIDFKITVNNIDFGVRQREENFIKTLDTYLQKGNNVIQLKTDTDPVDIISLKLEIKKVRK